MTPRLLVLVVMIAAPSLACGVASGADTTDDRIVLSADGSTLSHTDGGGGGSAAWLHNFDSNMLVGVAAEHQELSIAQWTFGSVNGGLAFGSGGQRYVAYAEAHEGAGEDGPHPFHYSIEGVGLSGSYFSRLTTLVEDKRIDVESTHGNLPKVGLSYLWNPHLQTSVSYSYSVSGNLGTRLPAIRLDAYGPNLNYLAGGAYGPASAAVLGIAFTVPIRRLKEAYMGVSKPLPHLRSDITLIADYQDLSGTKRTTITLNYIVHVGAGSAR
jgi:hypothetical protein